MLKNGVGSLTGYQDIIFREKTGIYNFEEPCHTLKNIPAMLEKTQIFKMIFFVQNEK